MFNLSGFSFTSIEAVYALLKTSLALDSVSKDSNLSNFQKALSRANEEVTNSCE
jgi:hypothetical protein